MLGAQVDLIGNLPRLKEAMGEAAVAAGRKPDEVVLIGVSKTQRAEAGVELIRAGLEHSGENRVQEAADKLPRVRELLGNETAAPICHMIGHLQSNKAAQAASLFDRIDSVDSVHLAQALSRRIPEERVLPVLLEVYVGNDPQRPGIRADQLLDVAGQI